MDSILKMIIEVKTISNKYRFVRRGKYYGHKRVFISDLSAWLFT